MTTVTLQDRFSAVRLGLAEAAERAGRDPTAITITAVSKTVDYLVMLEAYELGLRHFGENRIQDTREKLRDPLPADFILHLIGQLQSNKVAHAVRLFHVIESVDRPSLVAELEKQTARLEITRPVLLQVNVAGEGQKAGCDPEDASAIAQLIVRSEHLRLDGLMTMAPLVGDSEDVRFVFRGLRELRVELQQHLSIKLPVLSMGMTNDYQVAIAEGATHIRVGRAIFG